MHRGKFYILLMALCLCSIVWIIFCINTQDGQGLWQGCLSKQILHIPCPSCGTTRSVISIIKGDFFNALLINPLGYIAIISLVIIPIWIIFDCSTGKSTLVNTYHICLRFIKQAYIYIPLIVLTICNWIWNIVKYT